VGTAVTGPSRDATDGGPRAARRDRLVLGAVVTFVIDKRFVAAACAAGAGAVLSFVGLIHAPQVDWAAAPQVALGYLLLGLVCLGYGLLSRGTGTPVTDGSAHAVTPPAADAEPVLETAPDAVPAPRTAEGSAAPTS
jgi:AGZA family xanthine/uracil permease-like MFS transporter